jgi:hypothetical protein
VLHDLPIRTLSEALQGPFVGFPVGFLRRGKRNMKARQALSFALEVQVQNIE